MAQTRLFEQPKIYFMFILFILFIYLLNKGFFQDETLATSVQVLFLLTVASFIIYSSFKSRLKINAVHKNTGNAIVWAMVMVGIVFLASTVIGLLLGFASSIFEANSLAMVGAFPPLLILDHTFLTWIIFVFFIPVIESVTSINILDLTLSTTKSTYRLDDPKVWVASMAIGIGAIFYHIYAKFIPITGQLNIHALMIVFVLFTVTGIFAVYTKEMESPIYGHIGNNAIAMFRFLR